MAGMAAAALGNAVSRATLPWSFQRVVFAHQEARPVAPLLDGFGTQYVSLSEANVFNALMASGAIPYVFDGVYEIEGAVRVRSGTVALLITTLMLSVFLKTKCGSIPILATV
jgi:hypothetical protein